ncbi:OmpA family protein [Flavobacterium sp. '19STA2R22 D10 B1']|uniref:OmpA family protein n=1 Tax=Flavobacterium aerium TaxID=3037261 RepID=UPI00278C1370|nr:OmpA family protein [Flavobacterium sp. '19STA2R22 D10 B1']
MLGLSFTAVNAQETNVKTPESYNKWSIDLMGGINKPTTPFSAGSSTSRANFYHADLGVRYMFNTKFGLKADVGFDNMENADNTNKFKSQYYRTSLQGVVNLGRVLEFENWTSRLNILAHTGVGYSQLRNKDAYKGADEMVNFIVGLTGQIKLSERVALNADFTMVNNIDQNRTFDGAIAPEDRGFNGTLYNASVGISIYLGKNAKHADWYAVKNDDIVSALDKRVSDIETMLVDSDQDGVPDYLDVEPNSITGVAVDTKGRSIDRNQNGIPDELESYLEKKYGNNSNTTAVQQTNNQLVKDLINGGYVTTYFDFNKTTPTNVSTEGIDFILTYLRNNPSASVEIVGHADELGKSAYNTKLSNTRATNVKNVLTKAGIAESRLKVVAEGEDNSVDKNSAAARKLVRRVTFQVK